MSQMVIDYQVSLKETHRAQQTLLSKAKSPSLFVRRFDEGDIKLVLVSRIQLLGTSKQDRERAEKTDEILRAYNHAVAILRGDV